MKINELIEKYTKGETSLEEEKDLKKYLLNAKVLPQQIYLKHIFKYLQNEKDTAKLSEAETVQLEEYLSKFNKKTHKIRTILHNKTRYIIYAAAIIACIVIGFFTINYFLGNSQSTIVINNTNIAENKDVALIETERALSLVAVSMNTVYDNLDKLEYIEQSIEKLKVLELINNYKQK